MWGGLTGAICGHREKLHGDAVDGAAAKASAHSALVPGSSELDPTEARAGC